VGGVTRAVAVVEADWKKVMTGLLARGASVSRLAMEVDSTESEGEGRGVWLSAAVGDVLIATLSREIVDPKDRVKLACELTGPAVTRDINAGGRYLCRFRSRQ
jgi:hypothetical protein